MNIKGKRRKNQVVNIFEQQEMIAKAEVIKNSLKAFTWHELETNGKFDKNDKLTFISDDLRSVIQGKALRVQKTGQSS